MFFNIKIPGGGVGLFNGCKSQFGNDWGETYGGVSSREQCEQLPNALKAGCRWRFDWFKGANNPNVSFKPIECPSALTQRTGCRRA
jgi:hypothetical protein